MNITAPHFTNEDKAREKLEALRWPGHHQQCGQQHLHRYLAEYDFRYSLRPLAGSMMQLVPMKP